MLRRLALGLLVTAVACSSGGGTKSAPAVRMTLASSAFAANAAIPSEFTCDGVDRSPPLEWSGAPKGTQSFALILEDLDRSFLHWLVFDLPSSQTHVDAGYAPASAAVNDFGKQGYGGPCPPAGERHRYRFTVLALNGRVQRAGQVSGKQLQQQLLRSPLGRGDLTVTYQRP